MTAVTRLLLREISFRALHTGKKTSHRIAVKQQPDLPSGWNWRCERTGEWHAFDPGTGQRGSYQIGSSPLGVVGDLVWIPEAFAMDPGGWDCRSIPRTVEYRADALEGDEASWPWLPASHMRRWASRLTLRITQVRVERLQDIGIDDAIAEGIGRSSWPYSCSPYENYGPGAAGPNRGFSYAPASFRSLWDHRLLSRDGYQRYGWHKNPWVWVYRFEVLRANVDKVLRDRARPRGK